MAEFIEGMTALLALILILWFIFLPTYIACKNNHKFKLGVFLFNFFFSWTVFGWVLALIWAVCNDRTN